MLSILFLGGVSLYLYRLLGGLPQMKLRRQAQGQAVAAKIEELTEYASRLRATKKYSAAEQVYMQILELDHRHVSTYSRLGTLYSVQRNHTDAIECFEMTTQLAPSGSTFYNLGLAYFENRNYLKAIAAFEKAIMFEPTLQRFVGLAKAFRKTDDNRRMIEALEQAVMIEASPKVLWLLADAYAAAGHNDEALAIQQRIRDIDPKDERLRAQAGRQPGRRRPAAKVEKAT
jgi:tetratricopeptide (TPR) repeat protein